VRSFGLVVDAPRFDGPLRIVETHEPVLVEALLRKGPLKLSMKAFCKGESHAAAMRPLVEILSREFRSVIAHNGAW
jgi:hypothetical protein